MKTEIKMKRDKECKGSVRFATEDPKAAVTNVYVSRSIAEVETAQEVVVTVQVGS